MRYHYRLWCSDCCGEDYRGCFDGGTETDGTPYDTPQEANKAGWEATLRNIWEYDVVDEDGVVVDVVEAPCL